MVLVHMVSMDVVQYQMCVAELTFFFLLIIVLISKKYLNISKKPMIR